VKNWTNDALRLGGLLLCSGLATGCLFVDDEDDDDDPVPAIGTLTIDWTIDGQTSPADCAAFGVDRMELVLYEGGDEVVQEVEPLCESFSVSVDMLDGLYYGDATLVDSFDRAATLTLPIDDIDIIGGTELVIPIDFPLDSFL
jgi:hypothetical protein